MIFLFQSLTPHSPTAAACRGLRGRLASRNSRSISIANGCAPPNTRRATCPASASGATASRRSSLERGGRVVVERVRVIPPHLRA